ncbi:hypothetical protein [Saccharothrix sp. HUAS TT1]
MVAHSLQRIVAALALCAGIAVIGAPLATADEATAHGGPYMPPYSALR